MTHRDYITDIKNNQDKIYLTTRHFPINMRLFQSSEEYKQIIHFQCNYIRMLCLAKMDGYALPYSMSSAKVGLSSNIIGLTVNRGKENATCLIMINPTIIELAGDEILIKITCGSLILPYETEVLCRERILVSYSDEHGVKKGKWFNQNEGSLAIQNEIDYNLGLLTFN